MKTILILFLAITTVFASAMSMHRPFRKSAPHPVASRPVVTKRPANTTHPVETKRPVNTTEKTNPSWKAIAAGGAAAATTVAAYKISDGVEDGLKISAERAPTSFLGAFTLSGYILPVTVIGGLIVIGFIVAHNH